MEYETLDTVSLELPLVLPAKLHTSYAEDLRVWLVMAIDHSMTVEIDASAVETVGQACLQLLVAARSEAVQLGKTFTIEAPSAAFVERVQLCGLADKIGLSAQEAGEE